MADQQRGELSEPNSWAESLGSSLLPSFTDLVEAYLT